MSQDRPAAPIDIRPAHPREHPACRALLPEAFPPIGWAPQLFLAASDESIVGALAIGCEPGGFPILLQVDEAWRRHGIGRRLLHAAASAVAAETPSLRAGRTVDEGSPAALFLAAQGFQLIKRLSVFEGSGEQFSQSVSGLLARVKRLVPDGVSLVPLAQAPAGEVVRLVSAEFAVPAHEVAWRIDPPSSGFSGSSAAYDRDLSLAVLYAGTLAGVTLCRRSGPTLEIDLNVVAPAYRGRWPNLVLVEAVARLALAAGITNFRISAEAHALDTLNIARRGGATALPPQLLFALPLPIPSDASLPTA